jgi:diguanylate cyclase (GGDEF)-like protein/PAS domain S-box-containing protein
LKWQGLTLRSLRNRVTLFTLAVFVAGLWSLAFYSTRELREDMFQSAAERQRSTVAVLAAQVEREVATRLQALQGLALKLGQVGLQDRISVQAELDLDALAHHLFNRGVFVTGRDGRAIAASPVLGRIGVDYSDRDYITSALDGGRAGVGRPVLSKSLGTAVVPMSAPVRDRDGRIIGAVVGNIGLGEPNFLDQITGSNYGESGGYFVIAPAHRLVVTASDRRRVMQPMPAPGINPVADRIAAGDETSLVTVNPLGVEVLSSRKSVPSAGWAVAVSLPTEEAFAPIRRMQQRMMGAAVVLTAVAGGLVAWMLRRQMAPMQAAVRALDAQAAAGLPSQPLPVGRADEVGDLISGFNRLLATLAQRQEAYRISAQALQSISEAVVITGPDQAVVQANEAHMAITGYSTEELLGRNLRLLQGPHTDPATVATIRSALAGGAMFSGEVLNYRKDGSPFWNDLTISPVHDEAGRLTHFVGVTRDVSLRKQVQEQVNRLAFHDGLTQLPNRRLLNDRLEQALASSHRNGQWGALLFVDLDDFKPLNDRFGHDMGDLLLVQAAERMRQVVRETDTVARFGGDEFVVMLPGLSVDAVDAAAQARSVAEKLRAALALPYRLQPLHGATAGTVVEHHCSASIGLTWFLGHQATRDEVLRRADAAMYRAKDNGRNAVWDEATGT